MNPLAFGGPVPHMEQSIRGLYGSSGIVPAGSPLVRSVGPHSFNWQGLLGSLLGGGQKQDDEEDQLQPGTITYPQGGGLVPLTAYTRRNPLSGLFG